MQYVCGQMSRAAQKRNPGRGSQRLHRALGGTRILLAAAPTAPPCFCRWQRSSLLHRGFPPPDYSAGRCCSNPPLQPLFKADKTETPVPGSDTGVLGGRGWIRTSSTITIRWMRFEIVMDSCAFFEFYQKSIIGYHNHLGTKTGYKVGYFARGEYSARASETAIAAVSALPSTA